MNEHARISSPCCNHLCANNGIAKGGGGRKYPGVMVKQRSHSFILQRYQLSQELCFEHPALLAFVSNLGLDPDICQQPQQLFHASSWNGQMFWQ